MQIIALQKFQGLGDETMMEDKIGAVATTGFNSSVWEAAKESIEI
jgi:hypothetical protein